MGHRGRLGGKGAWQSEGERSDSEANEAEEAEDGAALETDDIEVLVRDAAKTADESQCASAAKVAYSLDPDRWGPATVADVYTYRSDWNVGNPFYDALRDGRETFDVPLLSLTKLNSAIQGSILSRPQPAPIKHWRADFPVLSEFSYGAYSGILSKSSFLETAELFCPSLKDGYRMFSNDANLESVKLRAPMLTSGL